MKLLKNSWLHFLRDFFFLSIVVGLTIISVVSMVYMWDALSKDPWGVKFGAFMYFGIWHILVWIIELKCLFNVIMKIIKTTNVKNLRRSKNESEMPKV